MKIIITGASGLLGRALMKEFSFYNQFKVLGLALNRSRDTNIKLNLLDFKSVIEFISDCKPNYIIHAAAERRPDICENNPEMANKLNILATENLTKVAKVVGAWILYISTNYVFDGKAPPYKPNSKTNPLNNYGKSKLGGEKAMWRNLDDACVLRLPILYGQVENIEESSVTAIAKIIKCNSEIEVDNWAIRYPTLTADVAHVCRQIIEHKNMNSNFKGIFHWSAQKPYTKYQMALIISEILNIKSKILPIHKKYSQAPRPKNCKLDISDLQSLNIGKDTEFKDGIAKSLKSLYF